MQLSISVPPTCSVCHTVSKLLWIIGHIFAFDRGYLSNELVLDEPLNSRLRNFGNRKLETWCKKYFLYLQPFTWITSVTGRQTDGQTLLGIARSYKTDVR